jgi:pyruvate formate lyase activating enzyme
VPRFDDAHYRKLGGTLANVLAGIERFYRSGMWLELLTLVVPGFNDSDDELRRIAGFIADLSPDIPWHVTAFHPDYKMQDRARTPATSLLRAVQHGEAAGLRYIYAGNLPGAVGKYENTRCPHCQTVLVERRGFAVSAYHLRDGHCPQCQAEIPGRWHTAETLPHVSYSTRTRVTPIRA